MKIINFVVVKLIFCGRRESPMQTLWYPFFKGELQGAVYMETLEHSFRLSASMRIFKILWLYFSLYLR